VLGVVNVAIAAIQFVSWRWRFRERRAGLIAGRL
jgi:hypothetical protein